MLKINVQSYGKKIKACFFNVFKEMVGSKVNTSVIEKILEKLRERLIGIHFIFISSPCLCDFFFDRLIFLPWVSFFDFFKREKLSDLKIL